MWLLAALVRLTPGEEDEQARDRAAIDCIAAGDTAAFAGLYDRHARRVYSLALRIVQDGGDAEDVVQDVFAQAWRQVSRFDPGRGPVAAWLLTMARTRAIDRLRAKRARREDAVGDASPAMRDAPAPGGDTAAELVTEEQARRVREALGALPLLQRLALELAYFEGLSQREIAERLEQPLGTVKTRMRTALLRLREALGEEQA